MQKRGLKVMGSINAIAGLMGLLAGILALVCAVWGMVALSRADLGLFGSLFGVGKVRWFFWLGMSHSVLIGILMGGILFVSGLGLSMGRAWGRSMGFSYAGGKLLLGVITLAAIVLFFFGKDFRSFSSLVQTATDLNASMQTVTPDQLNVQKTVNVMALKAKADNLQYAKDFASRMRTAVLASRALAVLMSLSLVMGFFLAIAQFFMIGGKSGGGEAMDLSTGIIPGGGGSTVTRTPSQTIVAKSTSKTISIQLYQNDRPKEMRTFELFTPEHESRKFLIGRDSDCDLAVGNDMSVSAKHCDIRCDDDGQPCLTDLDAKNGTLLIRGIASPREVMGRTRLEHGDTIALGRRGRSVVRVYFDWAPQRRLELG